MCGYWKAINFVLVAVTSLFVKRPCQLPISSNKSIKQALVWQDVPQIAMPSLIIHEGCNQSNGRFLKLCSVNRHKH